MNAKLFTKYDIMQIKYAKTLYFSFADDKEYFTFKINVSLIVT